MVLFEPDALGILGRVLSPSTRSGDQNHRVSDDCLRWHYRQAILMHMRGVGERLWDRFDEQVDDMDMMMREQANGQEIIETELATRLGAYIQES